MFGSYSDGTATESSDVDILVELDYSEHVGLRFLQMGLDLERLLEKKVDLIPYDGLSRFIRSRVEAQKQLVYEK